MLTCGTGPAPVLPLPASHWLDRLVELHARIVSACAAADAPDADLPMVPTIAANVESKRVAYLAIYTAEHEAAEHLARMIRNAEQRATEHEQAVRLALAEGQRPPIAADAVLVSKIIEESKIARDAAYPAVEQAGREYQTACTVAASSRALLLRLRREPERIAAERVLQEIRDVDSRVEIARSMLDAAALEIAFRREGLLR